MRKYLHLWLLGALFQLSVPKICATDYVVNYGYEYGTFYFQNGVSASNTYAAYWLSTQTDPQLKLAVVAGYNNIDVKNNLGALFVGRKTSPYELSVSEGYVITGYTVVGKALSSEQTFTPEEGGSAVTFNATEESVLVVEGLRTESTRFTLTGANSGLGIISFEVYIDIDAERTADLNAHYEAALSALTSGNQYWISTSYPLGDQTAKRYYLTSEGSLTDDFAQAYPFTLASATTSSTFRPVGWKATNISFSRPYIERGYLVNVNHIMTNTEENRDDWEAQVYLKGEEHFAIRATNVNTAENFANTYWTVTDINEDNIPEANYSEERTYVWDVTPYDAIKEASILLAALVEECNGFLIEKCDVVTTEQFCTLLEQSREIANSDFDSDEHNEECITLYPKLGEAYNTIQTSIETYKNYQSEVNKVRQAASSCVITSSPLATELFSLATQLQSNIDEGTAQGTDYQNVDNLIAERKEYWSKHLTTADIEPLRNLLAHLSLDIQWNLEADELTLDGITITEGTVNEINLSNRGISGQFPLSTLLAMPHLTTIDLSANSISNCDVEWDGSVAVDLHYQKLTDVVEFDLPTCDDSTLPSQLAPILMYNNGVLTTMYSVNANGHSWAMGLMTPFESGEMQITAGYPFVYERASGDVVTFTSSYGDAAGSTFPMRITFGQGDAGFDGILDISDLQIMINYIFDSLNSGDMFNFTAANLWEDDKINVQDVVKEVDLLLGQICEKAESKLCSEHLRSPLNIHSRNSCAPASLYFDNGRLELETETPVAALDIILNTNDEIDWSVLRRMGFSVTSRSHSDCVHVIIYSMSGAEVPVGETLIATTGDYAAHIVTATLADTSAKHIDAVTHSQTITKIGQVTASETSRASDYYDLQGRAVSNPTRCGIYLHKGRKIVVK